MGSLLLLCVAFDLLGLAIFYPSALVFRFVRIVFDFDIDIDIDIDIDRKSSMLS